LFQDYICPDSGLYLQYDYNHPKSVKNGIVNTLLHRAETHSSNATIYREKLKKIDEVLQTNKYPKQLVDAIKQKRPRNTAGKKEENPPITTITLPYVPRLGEKI
jgi:hypothetical protein